MIVEGIDEHGVTNTLWDDLDELRGMAMGCWCSPFPCHGIVLKELLLLTQRPTSALIGKPLWQQALVSIRESDVEATVMEGVTGSGNV